MNNHLPLISVIIPVYNVECYLHRCLNSVLNQTYSHLEILLVDDGSTDSSGKICDEFSALDQRVKIIHKENGGLSDARNRGIDEAKGEYITFIDSDDYIDEDMIEYLYGLLTKMNTKISVCTNRLCNEDTGKIRLDGDDGKEERLTSCESCRRLLYSQAFGMSACAKLYHHSLFTSIRYPKGKLYEDTATTYKFLIKAGSVAYGRTCKYNYCLRSGSITRRRFDKRQLDLITMADAAVSDIVKRFPELSQAGMRFRIWARFSTLNRLSKAGPEFDKDREKIIRFIRIHSDSVLHDPCVQRRDKVGIWLLKWGGLSRL